MSTHPIDIVIPWVDGSDPVWQADHANTGPPKAPTITPPATGSGGCFAIGSEASSRTPRGCERYTC